MMCKNTTFKISPNDKKDRVIFYFFPPPSDHRVFYPPPPPPKKVMREVWRFCYRLAATAAQVWLYLEDLDGHWGLARRMG